jgi:hypothetical protein
MVIENNNDQEMYQVESIKNDILVHTQKLYGLNLENPRVKDQYYRKYVKIQDLLASIGGIIKLIITVSTLLNSFYSSKQFIFNISNECFVENRLDKNCSDSILGIVSKNKPFFNCEQTFPKILQEPTKFDFRDYIRANCKKRSKYTKEKYNLITKTVEKCLDICFIVQQLLHVEMIIAEKNENQGTEHKKLNINDYFSLKKLDDPKRIKDMQIIKLTSNNK